MHYLCLSVLLYFTNKPSDLQPSLTSLPHFGRQSVFILTRKVLCLVNV